MLAEKNPQVAKAVAKLVELNAEERERMIADSRMKLRWDIANIKRSAEKEGMERGLEKGREEGREEERLMIARNLLNLGLPIEEIAQATGLSHEIIQALPH